jgi:SAM-dependent methyltransferase
MQINCIVDRDYLTVSSAPYVNIWYIFIISAPIVLHFVMKLKHRRTPYTDNGYPDYFDDRHKRKMLRLAEIRPFDVFYDLGCGNASILILAVKEFGVKKAVGIEDNLYRINIARKRIKEERLQEIISIEGKEMYEADLTKADVIFDMLAEDVNNMKKLYSQKIRKGTRLVKHDLPLLGYLPDKIDYPFYRMSFPLKKAKSKSEWTSQILGKENASIDDVWHELFYYEFTKGYDKEDIRRFKNILSKRIKK